MNVVVVVMDTARWQSTPTERGVFTGLADHADDVTTATRAYTPAPWTLPSHASLFTGTYPSKHGAHAGHKRLDETYATLAELLADEGYETVAISNNTWVSEEFGFGRGFETFHKTWQYVQSETDLGRIARTRDGVDKLRGVLGALFEGNPATNLANAVYGQFFRRRDDDGAARTNAWVDDWLTERDDSRPFFLFVNYLEPHLEYRPPERHAREQLPDGVSYDEAMAVPQEAWAYIAGEADISEAEFEILRGLYRAEISYLGDRVEDLVAALERAGEFEETLFVLTSDHGENVGEHGLMDHQYSLYETLTHVPLFLTGGPFDGGRIDEFVQTVDIPPTILDAIGADPSARAQFQGQSFHPDAAGSRDHVVAEYLAPQPSMAALERRVGDLPADVRRYDRSLRAIRTDTYSYIRGSDGSRELYDLEADPRETENVADQRPEPTAELDTRLTAWLDSFDHADADRDGGVEMSDSARRRLEDLGYLQ
jgi:arylsulfatase A-like enzyme